MATEQLEQESDQIKRHIEAKQAALGENLRALETRVKDATDIKQLARTNPAGLLMISFAAGLFLAVLIGERRR